MNPWIPTFGLLILLLSAPVVLRLWRKSQESREAGGSGTDLLPLTGKNLDEMVARGLLTAEEAERVRAKTRLQMKRALEEKLARDAAAANPGAALGAQAAPVDPVAFAAAEARRARATVGAMPSIPAAPPAETVKRPRLPERLAAMHGRPDSELQELLQAGFLSEDDLRMLKEHSKS